MSATPRKSKEAVHDTEVVTESTQAISKVMADALGPNGPSQHSEDEPDNRGPILWHLDSIRLGRVIVCIVSLAVSIGYLMMALDMPQGTGAQPGPGMWPVAVGGAWIVISLIVIGEALFTQQVVGSVDFPKGIYRRDVILYLSATLGFIIALPWLGQYIAAVLYTFVLFKFLSKLPLWRVILNSLIVGIGVSALFIIVLQVRMPKGVILPMLGL